MADQIFSLKHTFKHCCNQGIFVDLDTLTDEHEFSFLADCFVCL